MYVPTLPTENPTTKFLNGNKEWANITSNVLIEDEQPNAEMGL